MRIVFATHAYAPVVGGAERYAQGLAEALAGLGHEVHVLAPNRVSAEAFYTAGYPRAGATSETVDGVVVHRIRLDPPLLSSLLLSSFGRAGHSPISDNRRQRMWGRYEHALHDTIADLAPDATITLPHDFPNVAAALSARERGIGVYAPLLHEQDPAWDLDTIAKLVAQSDTVLAMTQWERQRLIDAYGATPETTVVVPPGVDAPDVESVAASARTDPYVLSVGRRTASKNLPATAAVVSALRSRASICNTSWWDRRATRSSTIPWAHSATLSRLSVRLTRRPNGASSKAPLRWSRCLNTSRSVSPLLNRGGWGDPSSPFGRLFRQSWSTTTQTASSSRMRPGSTMPFRLS